MNRTFRERSLEKKLFGMCPGEFEKNGKQKYVKIKKKNDSKILCGVVEEKKSYIHVLNKKGGFFF